ncbi:MAG TPA: hypothetical protein VMT67_16310 [Terriglobales bacterium]|nr:hypothetical protein [Terriglobales bacterium]
MSQSVGPRIRGYPPDFGAIAFRGFAAAAAERGVTMAQVSRIPLGCG